jgi:uncharacterized protein YjbI with pentapeptide repeats
MRWRDWVGVGERRWKKAPDEEVQPAKTLWDWLQLLIVPAILIGVTFVWSATQTRSDNKREDRRIAADRVAAEEARRDATLRAYLDQMSHLMLEEKLLTSKASDAVRPVARSLTLTTLRRLDGRRKAAVLRFLYEARLIDRKTAVVSLRDADFKGAELFQAHFEAANLSGAYFNFANLRGVVLDHAILDAANFRGANMRHAFLRDASIVSANLRDANLREADLNRSSLSVTDLRGANLLKAELVKSNLQSAFFTGANLTEANLTGADLRDAWLYDAVFDRANLAGADLDGVLLGPTGHLAQGLNLGAFITDLPPERREAFLDSEETFFDSLSRKELSKFNLSPEKLARFRREAGGG